MNVIIPETILVISVLCLMFGGVPWLLMRNECSQPVRMLLDGAAVLVVTAIPVSIFLGNLANYGLQPLQVAGLAWALVLIAVGATRFFCADRLSDEAIFALNVLLALCVLAYVPLAFLSA